MNSLYWKAISLLVAAAVIVIAGFAIHWNTTRAINRANQEGFDRAASLFAKQREEDGRRFDQEMAAIRTAIARANEDSRVRITASDTANRARSAALLASINQLPEREVGEQLAAVLDASQTRWPE